MRRFKCFTSLAFLCLTWIIPLLGVPVADAVPPPTAYEQAREKAMYHVQVKMVRVVLPPKTPEECGVTGKSYGSSVTSPPR